MTIKFEIEIVTLWQDVNAIKEEVENSLYESGFDAIVKIIDNNK